MYLELYYVKLHILILWTRYGLIANNVTDRAVFTNYWRKNFFQHSVTSPKQNTHTYTQQIKQKSANLSKLLEVLFLKIKKDTNWWPHRIKIFVFLLKFTIWNFLKIHFLCTFFFYMYKYETTVPFDVYHTSHFEANHSWGLGKGVHGGCIWHIVMELSVWQLPSVHCTFRVHIVGDVNICRRT